MPASPTATPRAHQGRQHPLPRRGGRRIRRQVGHRLRRDGPAPGAGEARRRRSAGLEGRSFADGLEIGSGTGYFSLNLLQLGIDRAPDRDRHLARHAAPSLIDRRGARARGSRRSGPRPSRFLSPTRASTSSSATRCSTTFPTSSAPSRSSIESCGPAAWSPSAASHRATATRWRRCPSAPALLLAPAWRRAGRRRAAAGPRVRAVARPRPRGRGRRARLRSLRASPHAGRRRLRPLQGPAARSFSPTPGDGGCAPSRRAPSPNRSPGAGASFAFRSYLALQTGRQPLARAAPAARALLQPAGLGAAGRPSRARAAA